MRRLLWAAVVIVLVFGAAVADNAWAERRGPIYLDRAYSPAERAADLVSRLTLAEKASQMISSMAAPVPRLGIAAYGWWNEAAHGVAREQTDNGDNPPDLKNTTSYPVSLSLGSTWDPDLVYREATQISDEAREVVRDNRLDLDFYSPTVNLARDPRWGRNDETYGEDPLLTATLAAQYVNGMQGQTEHGTPLPGSDGYLKTIATLKHYAANNSESNRLHGSSDMDERTLREYYTAQFRDIVKLSSPGAMMSSYNEVNGIPAAANVHLVDTLARQTYGFGGYFTSDCDAVEEIMNGQGWQPPGDPRPIDQLSRTAYALTAGEDLNCDMGYHDDDNYATTIPAAVAAGLRTFTGRVTENNVDVSLTRLYTARIELGEFDAQGRVPWVAAARRRLAPGTWTDTDANRAVTETPQRLALARQAADESIVLLKNSKSLLPLKVPSSGRFRVAVIGTYANPVDLYLGGYSSDQDEPGVAHEVNGYQGLKAAIQARDPGAQVDFLPGTEPGAIDRIDPAAIKAARNYDAVVVYAGTDESSGSEANDRTSLDLPGSQAGLIRQVAQANPRTIVYLETLGQVNVQDFAGVAPAILWSSYNGQQKGAALADVVLGDVDPGGHLPFTWYGDERQLPPTDDYGIRPVGSTYGRTYQYFTGTVAYPFGYGLSYTSFRLSDMTADMSAVDANGTVQVAATVTNTGGRAGSEVVQLYATTPDASASSQRPAKRLVAYRKIDLGPQAATRVTFPVRIADLAFFDEKAGAFRVDTGRYGLQLAASSTDVRQQVYVSVTGALRPVPAVVSFNPVMAGDAAAGVDRRLQFPAGARIDPRPTVALTDQSIYGYVTQGRSRPLPPGMTIRYSSDRPSVVSADLVARSPGVATITATVGSARGTFVVVVR